MIVDGFPPYFSDGSPLSINKYTKSFVVHKIINTFVSD